MEKSKNHRAVALFALPRRLFRGRFSTPRHSPADRVDWARYPKLLTISDTAKLLRVHPNTLRAWDEQGKLRAVRLGARRDRRYERELVRQRWLLANQTALERIDRLRPKIGRAVHHARAWYRPVGATAVVAVLMLLVSNSHFVRADQIRNATVSLAPRDCSGWSRSDQALKMDLSDGAAGAMFSANNSAIYSSTQDQVSTQGRTGIVAGSLDSPNSVFSCAGFRTDSIPAGATIRHPRLTISFSTRSTRDVSGGFVVATSVDGQRWTMRTVIAIPTEKLGRVTADLADQISREELSRLRVRITPDIDIGSAPVTAWLDGLAATVDVAAATNIPTSKQTSQNAKELDRLVEFSKAAFRADESPLLTVPKRRVNKFLFFALDTENWAISQVEVTDQLNNQYVADYHTTDVTKGSSVDSQLRLNTTRLHPGKYSVRITMVKDGAQTVTIKKEILWGVVALNVTRAVAGAGSDQQVGMAVLDDNGKTICDAAIKLTVTDPRGKKTVYDTKRGSVELSHKCVDKGVTNQPDYFVKLRPTREGLYHLHLEATTSAGQRSYDDTFTVQNSALFDVNRYDFPTRLYPISPYTVRLAITPHRDYRGTVQETVPKNFVISKPLPAGSVKPSVDDSQSQVIEWSVDWKQNETYYFGYTFKAPEISPALFTLGPMKILGDVISGADFQEPRQWQLASDSIASSLTRFTATSGATIREGTSITKSGLITDSYRATWGKDGTLYSVNGSNGATPGYEVHLNFDNVTLNGANSMILKWSAANGTSVRYTHVQICDWSSSTGVDAPADANCGTGGVGGVGGWRSIYYPKASGTLVLSAQYWRSKSIYNGYFFSGSAPGTAINTPLSNFVNGTQVKIRFNNTDSDTQAFNLDAAELEVAIDPQYFPSAATAIGAYPMSVADGYYPYTANTQPFTVTNDAVNPMDYYYSFKNIQTYTGANAVLVNYFGGAVSDTALTYNLGIYNFNSSSWENLHASQITATDIDLYEQSYFAKNNITLSQYISSDGNNEMRIRIYSDVANTATFSTSAIYIVIGSVNADAAKSETSFGKPDAAGTSVTATRDLDVAIDDGTAANTWQTTYCKNNTDSGCATVPNPMDYGSAYGTRYAASANISVPVTVPANGTVTGVYYAARFMSNTSAITTQAGLRDYGGTYAPTNGGWVDLISTSTIPLGTTASNKLTTHSFFDGFYIINPASMFDTTNNLANMRLRTSVATTTNVSTINREWDFAMMSIRWVNGPPTKQAVFTPTAENLVAGSMQVVGAANMASYRGVFAADSRYVAVNDGVGTTDIDYQLSYTGVSLLGANKISLATKLNQVNFNDGFLVQICDWVSSTGVDAAADATNCTVGGWRNLNNPKSTATYYDTTPFTYEIYDGYFYTGTAPGTKISTPLSNFVSSGTVKIRFYSGDRLDDTLTIDQAQLTVAIDPVYYADGVSANGSYVLSVNAGDYPSTVLSDVTTYAASPGLILNNNADNPIDTTFTFSNIRTYPGANAIQLQAYSFGSSGTMGVDFGIYNFTTASWENLHTGMITSAGGRTDYFAKSNINPRDYISYPPTTPYYGQIKIRAYSTTSSTDTLELKLKLVVGSVNADASKSEVSYGKVSAGDATNTRDLDSAGTNSVYTLTTCKNGTDAGCAGSWYASDSSNTYNTHYAFATNIGLPATAPANAQVTGLYYANRANLNASASGGSEIVVDRTRDSSGQIEYGWAAMQSTSFGSSGMGFHDGLYTTNPQNLIDPTTGLVYMKFATNSSTAVNSFNPDWDFSMMAIRYVLTGATITVSGNVYSDDATTVLSECNSVRSIVALRVAGESQSPVSCASADGSFTVTNVPQPAAGDVLFLWLTGVSSKYASTAVSYAGSSDVTSVKLRQNRLVLRSDYGSLTNSGLNAWQNSSDSDMVYSVASSNLTTESGIKLVVDGGTFAPGGTVTTTSASTQNAPDGDVSISSGATLSMVTYALSVGGDYANSGTFSKSSGQTVMFTATTTGFTIAPGSSSNFDNVTFNGASGGWTINAAQTVDGTMTLTDGAAAMDADVAITTALSVATSKILTINSGKTVTLAATSGTSLTLDGTITGAGTLTYKNAATPFPTGGTISSVLRMDATGGNLSLGCLGGGGRTFGGQVEIYNNDASNARTVTLCGTSNQTANFGSNLYLLAANNANVTLEANTNDPTVNVAGNIDNTGVGAGSETISIGSGTWTASGDVNFSDGSVSNRTGNTFVMNGTSKTLTVNAYIWLNNLTISPPDGATINVAGNGLFYSSVLSVATNKTLNINSGGVLIGWTSSSVTGTGAISGDGTYSIYQTGIISLPLTTVDVKYIAFTDDNGNQTIPARSYSKAGGRVTIGNYSGVSYVHTLGSGTFDILGDLTIMAGSTGTITVNGTANSPTVTIGGNLSANTTATAQTINTGNQTWTVVGDVTLTSMTVNATSGNTLKMTGTDKTLTSAGNSLYNFEVDSGGTNNVTLSGATTISNNLTITSGSLTAPAANFYVGGNWANAGTFVEGTGTVTLNGTASATLQSGCANTDACASQNFYNLIINKTDAGDANDNVTLTTNGINVANTLTITDGELIQGAQSVRADGTSAVSIAAAGKWTNISTGALKLGGTFVNAGTAVFNSNNGTQCVDGTDSIVITSTSPGTQRAWSGAGTFTIYNVNATDMTDSAITAYTSTLSNTTWSVGACGITVSGTVYQTSNESTVFDCNAVNLALRVSVNGAAATSGTCSAVGGTFTITGVTAPSGANIPVAVYTDSTANPSQKATTATLSADTGNISGLILIIDRLVVSQQNSTAMTNAYLATAKTNGDAGIRYGVSGGNLTVDSDIELHVLTGKTFTPGGTVTTQGTGDLHLDDASVMTCSSADQTIARNVAIDSGAALTAPASHNLVVGGDFTSSGTFTHGSGTVQMTGTNKTITTSGNSLYNLEIASGSTNNVTLSGATTVANNLTVTTGTLTAPTSANLSVGGDFTNNSAFTHNSSTVLMTGSGKSITGSSATTFNSLTISDSTNVSTSDPTVADILTVAAGKTLTIGTGRTLTNSGSTNVAWGDATSTITGGTLRFTNTTAGGPGTSGVLTSTVRYDASGGSIGSGVVDARNSPPYGGDVEFYSNSSSARTVTMASGTHTISGNLKIMAESSGSFEVKTTGGPAVTVTGNLTYTKGGSAVPRITSGSGTWTVTGNVDFSNGSYVASSNNTLLMNGTANIVGSSQLLYNFTVNGTDKTVTATSSFRVDHTLTVGGAGDGDGDTLTINTGVYIYSGIGGTVTLVGSGTDTIDGAGMLYVQSSNLNALGALNVPVTFLVSDDMMTPNYSLTMPARTYGGNVAAAVQDLTGGTYTISLGAGSVQFNGNLTLIDSNDFINTFTFDCTANPTVGLSGNFSTIDGGSQTYDINMGSGTWTVGGNFDLTRVGTFNHNSGTLVMSGTGKALTSAGNTLYNLEIASGSTNNVTLSGATTVANNLTITTGTLTAPASANLSVGGNFTNNSAFTHSSGTVLMTGAGKDIAGSSATIFNNLTISDSTTVAAGGSNQTVAGTLTVAANKTLTIGANRMLTDTGGDISWGVSSTIGGTGLLVFTNASGGPAIGGTLSVPVRFDATAGDIASTTFDARTYGGNVELYSSSSSSRTVTLTASPYTFSGNLNPNAAGAGDIAVAGDTNNPAVNITGNLDFTGAGTGTELIASGSGTWTVSGNVNLTDGYFAPSYVELSPSWDRIAKKIDTLDGACSVMTTYDCGQSGLEIGFDNQSEDQRTCPAVDTRFNSAAKYSLASINDGATIISTELVVGVASGNASEAIVLRYATDTPNSDACDESVTGLFSRSGGTGGTTVASSDWSTSGLKRVQLSTTENGQIKSRLTGSEEIAYGFFDACSYYGICPPTTTSSSVLRVGYTTSATSTLVMNGTGTTLTPGGNGFYNLTISGSVTLANEDFFISGNLDLTGSSLTGGTAIINMVGSSGTIKGGGQTVDQLKINPAGGSGTITLTGSDITVGYYLRVDASNTLTIDSGRVLTLTGDSLGLFGTISGNGDGRLTYTNARQASVDGTITAIFRYDASTNDLTMAPRTYGGPVEVYSARAASTVTLGTGVGSQDTVFASTLTLSTSGSGTVNLTVNPISGRSVTIAGDTTIGSGATLTAASSGKAFYVNGDFTNNGTFAHNSGTVTLAGSVQQNLSGTLTGATGRFNNLVVTNAFGDGSSTWSATFSGGLETAATFTAVTANTKLRFAAGATNTLYAINLAGAAGSLVDLRSSTAGTTTFFNVGAGTRAVTYTSIKDNDACGSSGGSIDASSDGTNVDLGNTPCWNINSVTFTWSGGNALHFGTLTTANTSWASTTTPTTSEQASGMSFTFGTNGAGGAVVTVLGESLTGPQTITPISGGPTAVATPGTAEQFGLRVVKASGSGSTSAVSPFNGSAGHYGYQAGVASNIVTTSGSPSLSADTYNIFSMANILSTTKPGAYSTNLTFIATGTF